MESKIIFITNQTKPTIIASLKKSLFSFLKYNTSRNAPDIDPTTIIIDLNKKISITGCPSFE